MPVHVQVPPRLEEALSPAPHLKQCSSSGLQVVLALLLLAGEGPPQRVSWQQSSLQGALLLSGLAGSPCRPASAQPQPLLRGAQPRWRAGGSQQSCPWDRDCSAKSAPPWPHPSPA